jgi:hypothetical protein
VCLSVCGVTFFSLINGHASSAVAACLATSRSTASRESRPPGWVGNSGPPGAGLSSANPESYDLDDLKALAERDDDVEMRVFKSELRQALREPARLPGAELSESVHYDNGSEEAFLVWLWHELHGDEPFDVSILTRLKALPEPFAGRGARAGQLERIQGCPRWRMGQGPSDAARPALGSRIESPHGHPCLVE